MTNNEPPVEPIDAYKAIVDGIVDRTWQPSDLDLYRTPATWMTPEESAFVRGLDEPQRQALASLCRAAKRSAVHDALAVLEWWLDTSALQMTYGGEPLPYGVGHSWFGDYIARCDGWEWSH